MLQRELKERKKQKDSKMEAASSSNISRVVEIQEEYPNTYPYPQDEYTNTYPYPQDEYPNTYPYPSDLSATSFVSVKLSGRDKYRIWKAQMLCLLKSHGMCGFIDGTLVSPQTSVSGEEKVGDHESLWGRSDAVVKGWILGSLSEQTLSYVLDLLDRVDRPQNAYIPAKDVWDELKKIYGPLDLTPPALVPPYSQSPPNSAVLPADRSGEDETDDETAHESLELSLLK